MRTIENFVSGAASTAERFGDVFDPNSGEVRARVRL